MIGDGGQRAANISHSWLLFIIRLRHQITEFFHPYLTRVKKLSLLMAHIERKFLLVSFRILRQKKCGDGKKKLFPLNMYYCLFRLLIRACEIWSHFTFLKMRNLCAAAKEMSKHEEANINCRFEVDNE